MKYSVVGKLVKELYAAIKSGSYNSGWIIPTRDILHGKDIDGKESMFDNILTRRDRELGAEAINLITLGDNKGLSKLLNSQPVDVRMKFNTGAGRMERLDEYASRLGCSSAVKILKNAGAPAF